MENSTLRDELEMRMNPEDFTITSNDLIDIMNMFDIDEQALVQVYSELISEKQSELRETTDEVLDYFREKGNYRPSFEDFKKVFKQYEENFIDNNILRNMYKNGVNDKNQMSLFEMQKIIKEELEALHERRYEFDDEFDDEEEQISRAEKNWGGAGNPEEEFDAEEFFGAAGDAAEDDIRAEFGDDEFAAFGTMEDPRMLKNLKESNVEWSGDFPRIYPTGTRISINGRKATIDNNFMNRGDAYAGYEITYDDGEKVEISTADKSIEILDELSEGVGQPGLFKPQDAEGNDINLKSLVKHIDSDKKGYVMGLGDDGAGNLIVRVNWSFPTDMRFTNPKEMGEMPEAPEHLIVQNAKTKNMNEEINEEEINEEIADMDASEGDAEETIEEMRGLGSGVKNSGDRNVKLRDDHAHAPLTNLNESIDNKIKSLMETKVTKKELKNFISEEAKRVAKQLKG